MKLPAFEMFVCIIVMINYIVLLMFRLALIWLMEMIDDLKGLDLKRLDAVWTEFINRDPGKHMD